MPDNKSDQEQTHETVFSIKFTIIQTTHPMSRYTNRWSIVLLASIVSLITIASLMYR